MENFHASPVHIILESRYVASKGVNVEKSRLTADLHAINSVLPDSSYPLPNQSQFRRECAEDGVKYFSNIDGASYFYQFRVDLESARENLCLMALGRLFVSLGILMGLKLAPSFVQAASEKMMQSHRHCKAFVDDFTTFSTTVDEHLDVDLPKTLALCSYHNVLLSPKKADILKTSCRILRFKISESATSVAGEKIDKISALTFPTDKKDLISKLAFLAYFMRIAPRLSELTAPLRELALPHIKFQPTELHEQRFKEAIAHLLDDKVCALRMPSFDVNDVMVVFTDASSHSLSSIVTQMMRPLKPIEGSTDRQLHIVACWSSVLKAGWLNYPIWLLELLSLAETLHKHKWLFHGRAFYVCTDSRVVEQRASLDKVPRDIARRIISLQAYDYRIIYLESRINPSDAFSRIMPDNPADSTYPRLLKGRIFNTEGVNIPYEQIFSERKAKEQEKFFLAKRHQQMSRAGDDEGKETDTNDDENDDAFFPCHHELTHEIPEVESTSSSKFAEEGFLNVSALELDDSQIAEGRVDEREEEELDENVFGDVELPVFDHAQLQKIRGMQNDETLRKCQDLLKEDAVLPTKLSAMAESIKIRNFLRHLSLFRISPQGVLLRLWTTPAEEVVKLIVVGEEGFKGLLKETHGFNPSQPSMIAHLGMRKTMAALSTRFYAFGMRKKVNEFVNKCSKCKMNRMEIF